MRHVRGAVQDREARGLHDLACFAAGFDRNRAVSVTPDEKRGYPLREFRKLRAYLMIIER